MSVMFETLLSTFSIDELWEFAVVYATTRQSKKLFMVSTEIKRRSDEDAINVKRVMGVVRGTSSEERGGTQEVIKAEAEASRKR